VGAGGEWGGGKRLRIDIRVAGADEVERHRFVLGDSVGVAVKEHLDGDGGDGARAAIGDDAVEVGDLASGEVGGLAHGDLAEFEAGGVGVERGVDGGRGRAGLRVSAKNEKRADKRKDDGGGESDGQPVAVRALRRSSNSGLELDFLTHNADFTP